jgi:hypothetical protein
MDISKTRLKPLSASLRKLLIYGVGLLIDFAAAFLDSSTLKNGLYNNVSCLVESPFSLCILSPFLCSCRVAFGAGGAWWDAYDVQVIWTLTPLRISRRPA